jgi:methyl-accepting chemotaxis protein
MVNLSSLKIKITLLIAGTGIILSVLLATIAPYQAKELGEDILNNDAEFISNLLVENLALGMQTIILDDGAALEQTLELLKNETGHATVSNVWIYDADFKFIKGLNDVRANNLPSNSLTEVQVSSNNSHIDIWSPMYDSDHSILGFVGVQFSKVYLNDMSGKNIAFVLLIGLIIVAGTVIFGIIFGRRIGKPISDIASIAQDISQGEINHTIEVNRKDEIGVLSQAFQGLINYMKELADASQKIAENDLSVEIKPKSENDVLGNSFKTMSVNLIKMVDRLSDNANQLVSSAAELAASSEEISRGANDQSEQVNQVLSAVEEMAGSISQASGNAGEASEASRGASDTASDGGEIVAETIQGMQSIDKVVRESAGSIGKLAQSAEEIGHIIGVIDDIADQTNLLALNAAIEAARAGEQGRGFAVVADEVRKLAERTGQATGEITSMIKGIQDQTSDAVKSMEVGINEVAQGREMADKAGQSLTKIVEVSQKVMDMMKQIASGTDEQTEAVEIVSSNVENISKITKETAGGAKQSAKAAEQLNQQAEELKSIVETFKLSEV